MASPHFEKVLYDNAQLLSVYAQATKLGGDALFEDALITTLAWLMREMRDDAGGFYASQDGASLGQRGRPLFVAAEQAKKLLDEDAYLLIETLYMLDKPASVDNHWILHRRDSYRSVIERLSMTQQTGDALLSDAKADYSTNVHKRTPPITDKKILSGWNGLLITGLCDAFDALGNEAWLHTAQEIADFLRTNCWDGEHLSVCWQDGKTSGPAYLDDYGAVLQGLLSLLSHRWRDTDASSPKALADAAIALFYDNDNGGFYFTGTDQPALIFNPKPSFDEALPPGNASLLKPLFNSANCWEHHLSGRRNQHPALGQSGDGTLSCQPLRVDHCATVRRKRLNRGVTRARLMR